jgi:hypothetical protein
MKVFVNIISFCLLMSSLCYAGADMEASVDFIFLDPIQEINNSSISQEATLRFHNTLFVKSNKKTHFGFVTQLERTSEKAFEAILGGGIKIGNQYFVEFDSGFLLRSLEGETGYGFGTILTFGKTFEINKSFKFRLTIPIVNKIVFNNKTKRHTIDYAPYFGLSYRF